MVGTSISQALPKWGDVELTSRASGGYANDVWFARVRGQDCVVRGPKRSADALQWEIDLLHALRGHGFGVPEVVPTLDGEASAGGVVVFRRVDGDRPSTPAHWARVRDYLQRLHETFRGTPQRPGFLSAGDLLIGDAGGIIDLRVMPEEAVARCRRAWARVAESPRTVIHGDPGEENIFMVNGEVVLIDWDEARVDVPAFDLAALPDEVCPLSGSERSLARRAASAWEAAGAWVSDSSYALWQLSQVEPEP